MVGFITLAPKRTLEEALGARSVLEARDEPASAKPKFASTFKRVVPKHKTSALDPSPSPQIHGGGVHELTSAGPNPKVTGSTPPAQKTATGKRLKNVSGLEARLEREAACMDELFGSNDVCPQTQPTQRGERSVVDAGRQVEEGSGAREHKQRVAAGAAAAPGDEHRSNKPNPDGARLGGCTLSGGGGLKLAPAAPKPNIVGAIKVDVAGCKFYKKAMQAKRTMGQKVIIEREPQNPHDSNAIKIVLAHPSGQVGHIPKDTAKRLSPLMDSGSLSLSGTVAQDSAEDSNATNISIIIKVTGFGPNTGGKRGAEDQGVVQHKEAWKWLADRIKRDAKKIDSDDNKKMQDFYHTSAQQQQQQQQMSAMPASLHSQARPARAPSWKDMQEDATWNSSRLMAPALPACGHAVGLTSPDTSSLVSRLPNIDNGESQPSTSCDKSASAAAQQPYVQSTASMLQVPPASVCNAVGGGGGGAFTASTDTRLGAVINSSSSSFSRPDAATLNESSRGPKRTHAYGDPADGDCRALKASRKGSRIMSVSSPAGSMPNLKPLYDYSLLISRASTKRCRLAPHVTESITAISNMDFNVASALGMTDIEVADCADMLASSKSEYEREAEEQEADFGMTIVMELIDIRESVASRLKELEKSSGETLGMVSQTGAWPVTAAAAAAAAPAAAAPAASLADSECSSALCKVSSQAWKKYRAEGARTRRNMVVLVNEGDEHEMSDDALADRGAFYLPACLSLQYVETIILKPSTIITQTG